MALAAYGAPSFLPEMREAVAATGDGGFRVDPIDWGALVKRRSSAEDWGCWGRSPAARVSRW